jgi:hypothetical protein
MTNLQGQAIMPGKTQRHRILKVTKPQETSQDDKSARSIRKDNAPNGSNRKDSKDNAPNGSNRKRHVSKPIEPQRQRPKRIEPQRQRPPQKEPFQR